MSSWPNGGGTRKRGIELFKFRAVKTRMRQFNRTIQDCNADTRVPQRSLPQRVKVGD